MGTALHGARRTTPTSAEAVGRAVVEGRAERGVLVCGSGVGASVAANKIPGIRAAICHDTYSAHQGVEHDDMNVLVLGGRIVGAALAPELVRAYVSARFTGEERHVRRLAKVKALDERGEPLRRMATTSRREPAGLVEQYGQSVWLDYIRRSLIAQRRAAAAGRRGRPAAASPRTPPSSRRPSTAATTTRPPSRRSRRTRPRPPRTCYELLAIKDIQDAADVLRPVYDRTKAHDGYVSLEVSPDLANDTAGDARRGAPALEGGRPAERDDQGAGHARGHPRHPHAAHRGHQRQRHAALRAGRPTRRWPRPTSRAWRRAPPRAGDRGQGRQRGQLLREPHRHRRRRPARGDA